MVEKVVSKTAEKKTLLDINELGAVAINDLIRALSAMRSKKIALWGTLKPIGKRPPRSPKISITIWSENSARQSKTRPNGKSG